MKKFFEDFLENKFARSQKEAARVIKEYQAGKGHIDHFFLK
ncbi:hypothetical protein [Alteribacillus bidgolensis]|uniref:Uncharacterized protein n=1 Tax=Alteribacillus bidgolensis TaxID=930129 RepID=A0A1G8MKH3_9BACI|nr:hypothetical protein [Alteribacillus bidgolensis]SDI68315.1 hypothetical protein SAMN05216352_11077 [Alteribacillus bidgolensis]